MSLQPQVTAAINGGNLGARYHCIYTDGIFPYQECIIHRHDHDVLSDQEAKENAAFCSIPAGKGAHLRGGEQPIQDIPGLHDPLEAAQ